MRNDMKRLAANINAAGLRLESRMMEIVFSAAERAAREARALAPVDSGELRSGIHAEKTGKFSASVLSEAPHGAMVELGTSRMAPRPHLLPAARAAGDVFSEAAHRALKEVLK